MAIGFILKEKERGKKRCIKVGIHPKEKATPSELQLREKEWLDKNVSLSQYHNLLMLARKAD